MRQKRSTQHSPTPDFSVTPDKIKEKDFWDRVFLAMGEKPPETIDINDDNSFATEDNENDDQININNVQATNAHKILTKQKEYTETRKYDIKQAKTILKFGIPPRVTLTVEKQNLYYDQENNALIIKTPDKQQCPYVHIRTEPTILQINDESYLIIPPTIKIHLEKEKTTLTVYWIKRGKDGVSQR